MALEQSIQSAKIEIVEPSLRHVVLANCFFRQEFLVFKHQNIHRFVNHVEIKNEHASIPRGEQASTTRSTVWIGGRLPVPLVVVRHGIIARVECVSCTDLHTPNVQVVRMSVEIQRLVVSQQSAFSHESYPVLPVETHSLSIGIGIEIDVQCAQLGDESYVVELFFTRFKPWTARQQPDHVSVEGNESTSQRVVQSVVLDGRHTHAVFERAERQNVLDHFSG